MTTRTLLIADDNAAMRRCIRELLARRFDAVVECADGAAAVEAYRAARPVCVLMDISMPGLDGLEATRRIRAIDPAARIIIVSDYTDGDFRAASLAAGASAFVEKENLARLLDVV